MNEEELKQKETQLANREVLLNVRERDVEILESRIKREYAKLYPGLEVNLRDV